MVNSAGQEGSGPSHNCFYTFLFRSAIPSSRPSSIHPPSLRTRGSSVALRFFVGWAVYGLDGFQPVLQGKRSCSVSGEERTACPPRCRMCVDHRRPYILAAQ